MTLRGVVFLTIIISAGNVAVPGALGVLDMSNIINDYRLTSWEGGDGITLGAVRSITQDEDGYLWLGSDAGLVRFDGARFTNTELVTGMTPLPNAPTRAVYISRDGSLWVGYGDGEGVYRIRNGEVRDVFLRKEFTSFVSVITEDRAGAIWVGHDGGLFRLQNAKSTRIELADAGFDYRVFDIHEDSRGTLWIATSRGIYAQTLAGLEQTYQPVNGVSRGIGEDRSGNLWVTDEFSGFRRLDGSERNPLFETNGMRLLYDSRGNLWVSSIGQGVWQLRTDRPNGAQAVVKRATVQTGLVSDENSDIFEDRDGNIWVGSIQGLNRFTPHTALSIVDIGIVKALTAGPGRTIWAATASGLVELRGVTPGSPGIRRVIATQEVLALHTTADGRTWAATRAGLFRFTAGRLVEASVNGPVLRTVTSIASDEASVLWICDREQGLVRIAGNRVDRINNASAGMSSAPLFSYIDGKRVWIAFDGGVVRMINEGGVIVQYGRAEGLTHSAVYAIYRDRVGELWVGGSSGLSHLRGDRFQTLGILDDPAIRAPASIFEDDTSDLWLGTVSGFIRIGRADLTRSLRDGSYRPRYHLYPTSWAAGHPGVAYHGAPEPGLNGTFWVIAGGGLVVLDPLVLRSRSDKEQPHSRIEGLTADGVRYAANRETRLPPRANRLRVDFTVVQLSPIERIRFRYRLDGFDGDWVYGTGPRQAMYTNLPAGDYRFRVQASNNSATWSEAESSWAFSIQPMFYRTGWFYTFCGLTFLTLAMGVWRVRLRQLRKKLAMVFGERLRLSREIHDTLLQSLVGLTLQLDSLSHDTTLLSSARTELVRMRREVEDYIREVRQSIWDMRSPIIDTRGLIDGLRSTGQRLTAGRAEFTLKVTGTPRPCPPKVETHILRIGHEAIVNAVHHAAAHSVQVEIAFEKKLLRVQIADDGRGFVVAEAEERAGQHYGLVSMKERATDAGGRCVIESEPGMGARVIAEFPLAS